MVVLAGPAPGCTPVSVGGARRSTISVKSLMIIDGGALLLYGANDFGGIAGRFENYGGAEERRNKQSHELAEDMAQGNERNEAQRVKPTLVLAILIEATLQRLEIGQKIAVGENDAAGLGGCARGVQDFGNGGSCGTSTWIHSGICRRGQAVYYLREIVDDH